MKICIKEIEQFTDFGSKGFFRSSGELALVILGVFPNDFNHIEFRAVRWQVAKEGVEFFHPAHVSLNSITARMHF